MILGLFFVVSALTSIISATVGMAGGTVLLSFLALFYGYRELIPLHAANQLVSNATRMWMLRKHVHKPQFVRFMIGSIVGVVIGTYLLGKIHDDRYPALLIAIYVLYELLKPKKLPSIQVGGNGFILVGLFIGAISMFVGATGLLLGVFVLTQKGSKEETIANQAAMQTFNHAAKLAGFLYLGWRMQNQVLAFLVLCSGAILGTRFGVKLLDRIPPKLFFWLFRAVLLAAAIKIIIDFILKSNAV